MFNFIKKWKLRKASKETPFFGLNGRTKIAKVVDIYDGDTIKIVTKTHKKVMKFNCRLLGIDTPELKPLKKIEEKERNNIIKEAKKSREFVVKFCEERDYFIKAECGKFDKYGRLLITVKSTDGKINLNSLLIEKKLAVPYFGGTKGTNPSNNLAI